MSSKKTLISLCVIVGFGLCMGSVQAQTQSQELQAIILISQMQDFYYHQQILRLQDIVTCKPRIELWSKQDIDQWDEMSKRLKKLVAIDKPDNERKAKFHKKMNSGFKEATEYVNSMCEKWNQKGPLDREAMMPMIKAEARFVYAADQLTRHLARDIDFGALTQDQRQEVLEIILLSRMAEELRTAIGTAFVENANWYVSDGIANFWPEIGQFDISSVLYQAAVDFNKPENNKKSELFRRLKNIKSLAVVNASKLYAAKRESNKTDFEALRGLKENFILLRPIFDKLMGQTVPQEKAS